MWLVASVGSPPLRQAAPTLAASFFRKMQAKKKQVRWKVHPEIKGFLSRWKRSGFLETFNNFALEKTCF